MTDLISIRKDAPWFRRLYLPAYRISDAARYVHLSTQAVTNWHHRTLTTGETALPSRASGEPLSYLELVEVGVVATFRQFGVPLASIARTREYFAQTFNAEYPFAEYRFKTDGWHLLMNLTEIDAKLPSSDLIVADQGGQIGWGHMMANRLFEFDYDEQYELALRWWVAGRESRVLIDPRIAFGAPMVHGVPTWVVKGRATAGETIEDIQEDFGLNKDEVDDALRFEGVVVAEAPV